MNRLNSIKKKLGKIHHCDVVEVFKGSKRKDLDIQHHVHINGIVPIEDILFYKTCKRKNKGIDKLQSKVKFKNQIEELSVDGKVAIVYGGVDCDHSRWDNRVALIDANVTSVNGWGNDYMECAEGRQWWSIESMDYALSLKESSRDLAMEAFEDGHPHVIYG